MWQIFEKKSIIKSIRKIPKEALKHYEIWKRIIELEGPSGLRMIKGFYDEALKGNLENFRSSRLTKQWRVIYKIEKQMLEVFVIDINPHDYRRR
jgi:addiction module RelE/StbE family toxin